MNNNKIYEKVKMKIAISKVKEEDDMVMKNKINIFWKTLITALTTLGIGTGVVFASTIVYNNIWKNEGINKASEYGYEQDINIDYNMQNNLGIKIDSLIVDDSNIGIVFNYQLSDEIKNIEGILINDLIITDENMNIIFEDGNEKSLCTSYSNELTYENNTIKQAMLLENSNHTYPNSQNINIKLKKVTINTKSERKYIYTGDWNFEITVDTKFIDREKITYESSKIQDIKVLNAELTSTALNLEIKFDFPVNAEYLSKNIKVKDKAGTEYFVSAMSASEELENPIIKVNFPITCYDTKDELTLIINLNKEYSLELLRKY